MWSKNRKTKLREKHFVEIVIKRVFFSSIAFSFINVDLGESQTPRV